MCLPTLFATNYNPGWRESPSQVGSLKGDWSLGYIHYIGTFQNMQLFLSGVLNFHPHNHRLDSHFFSVTFIKLKFCWGAYYVFFFLDSWGGTLWMEYQAEGIIRYKILRGCLYYGPRSCNMWDGFFPWSHFHGPIFEECTWANSRSKEDVTVCGPRWGVKLFYICLKSQFGNSSIFDLLPFCFPISSQL